MVPVESSPLPGIPHVMGGAAPIYSRWIWFFNVMLSDRLDLSPTPSSTWKQDHRRQLICAIDQGVVLYEWTIHARKLDPPTSKSIPPENWLHSSDVHIIDHKTLLQPPSCRVLQTISVAYWTTCGEGEANLQVYPAREQYEMTAGARSDLNFDCRWPPLKFQGFSIDPTHVSRRQWSPLWKRVVPLIPHILPGNLAKLKASFMKHIMQQLLLIVVSPVLFTGLSLELPRCPLLTGTRKTASQSHSGDGTSSRCRRPRPSDREKYPPTVQKKKGSVTPVHITSQKENEPSASSNALLRGVNKLDRVRKCVRFLSSSQYH